MWSAGCVMAELLLGHPLFPGESGVDQLVEIIKVCFINPSVLCLLSFSMFVWCWFVCRLIYFPFVKVLGTPSKEQIQCMNQNYTDFKFPKIKPHPWHKVE